MRAKFAGVGPLPPVLAGSLLDVFHFSKRSVHLTRPREKKVIFRAFIASNHASFSNWKRYFLFDWAIVVFYDGHRASPP